MLISSVAKKAQSIYGIFINLLAINYKSNFKQRLFDFKTADIEQYGIKTGKHHPWLQRCKQE